MPNWHDLGPTEQFPDPGHVCLEAGDQPIVVFHHSGQWSAMRNVCPHAGKPLGEGEVRGKAIVCPYHGFAYDIHTGRNADFPHDEPPCTMLAVEVTRGRVYVDLPA
jgi:nitrite reductase/ring-hydroxylating ferredoxin subunit